jgi:general secretion pathway protein G
MRPTLIVILTALVSMAGSAAADHHDVIQEDAGGELELTANLPKDPLVAWDVRVGNAGEIWDSTLALVRRFVPSEELPQVDEGIAKIDAELGFSLRDDLLAHLGPEMAGAIDVPPIDMAVGSIMSGVPAGIVSVIDGIGLWVQVGDTSAVDTALRSILAKAEARVSEHDGVVKVSFGPESPPPEAEGASPPVDLYYGLGNGVLSIGFRADTVRSRLAARPSGERLADGDDFRTVMRHLDPDPTSLFYLNLPRLQQLIADSEMAKGMLASDEELQPLQEILLDPEMASSGIGATATEVGGGVRQMTFGPRWVGGGMATAGVIAAIAIPNLINAIEVGRSKRTMADMRSLAVALETYAVDEARYPSSDGWVEVSSLAEELAPTYIEVLPTSDGWGNDLLYRSDGVSYRILSRGRDGILDETWEGEIEETATSEFNADIVFEDGVFVVYPESR